MVMWSATSPQLLFIVNFNLTIHSLAFFSLGMSRQSHFPFMINALICFSMSLIPLRGQKCVIEFRGNWIGECKLDYERWLQFAIAFVFGEDEWVGANIGEGEQNCLLRFFFFSKSVNIAGHNPIFLSPLRPIFSLHVFLYQKPKLKIF